MNSFLAVVMSFASWDYFFLQIEVYNVVIYLT